MSRARGEISIGKKSSPAAVTPGGDGEAVIDHQASILDDVDPCVGELGGEDIVSDALLEPHQRGAQREEVFEVTGEVLGAAEDVDEVERCGDVAELAHHRGPEDVGGLRVVDRDRDHLDANAVQVFGDVEGGLIGLELGLDPEHSDPPQRAKSSRQFRFVPREDLPTHGPRA